MSTDVLGWLQVIETYSPADLRWSAENPAPEEALTAVAVARGLCGMERRPLLRHTGPFPHPSGRCVAAVVTCAGPLMRVKLDPRIAVAGDLRAQAAALADAVLAKRRERLEQRRRGTP